MKIFYIICAITCFSVLADAEKCTSEKCKPPECRCSSTVLDENIPIENTPQLVMLAYDEGMVEMYNAILPLIEGRTNPDGCQLQATFFVSHDYSNYSKVHELWSRGHEIALHSITNNPLKDYWRNISKENITSEFCDQRKMMAHLANLEIDELKGIRVPHLALSGDRSFEVINDCAMLYDSSWPTQAYVEPGLWPYSLDYESEQDCSLGFCPNSSFPGVWIMPMIDWKDEEGETCTYIESCKYLQSYSIDQLVEWMVGNFNRIYKSNRAPFGVNIHPIWFFVMDNYIPAYKLFIDYMDNLPDVYFVSNERALQYTRYPKAINVDAGEMNIFDKCPRNSATNCSNKICQLVREDIGEERLMTSCVQECPKVYPWLFNPYGEN